MFLTKRRINNSDKFYLEDFVSKKGKRNKISVFIKDPNDSNAFLEKYELLKNKVILENAKETISIYKLKVLSFSEILDLEKLKYNYKLFKSFFPESFEQFEKDEFIRFAHGSASVEGNSLNLQQVTQVIEKNTGVSGKSLFEIKEIQNFKLTKKYLSEKKEISEKVIKGVHKHIMADFDNKYPVEYRTAPVYILGSEYKPIPASKVSLEMIKLVNFYLSNKSHIHPVELSAYFHICFESIHPFMDGNGRTGREIMIFILQKNRYCRAIINLENREIYISLLERLQLSKDYFKFTKFIHSCLMARLKIIEKELSVNNKEIINILKRKK